MRTLLHAITKSVALLRSWEDTLQRYKLPGLHALITSPTPYDTWKSSAKHAVSTSLQEKIQQALQTKASLSLFDKTIYNVQDLYPRTCTSKFIRQGVIIRSPLATQTYLMQYRIQQYIISIIHMKSLRYMCWFPCPYIYMYAHITCTL